MSSVLKEKWEEVCYFLSKNISPSISEEMFEQKVIQVFEKLGWSSFRGEIIEKPSYKVGSAGRIVIPDLVLKKDELKVMVEIKKPSVNIDDISFKEQLKSYMRLEKCEYGILIGSKVKIYYDGGLYDSPEPVLLAQVNFDDNDKLGIQFIENFSKESCSIESLKSFTLKMINNINVKNDYNRIQKLIKSEDYLETIKLLMGLDLAETFNENAVNEALEDIQISVSVKGDTTIEKGVTHVSNQRQTKPINHVQHYQKKGVIYEFRPSNEAEFKTLLLQKKLAHIKIFYNNGTTTYHPWNAKRLTEDSHLRGNIDSKTWFRTAYVNKHGVYKAIFSIEPID